MEWLVISAVVLAVVIAAILRKRHLERRAPAPTPIWEIRAPIPFEEFFDRYYATSGIPEATVFKLLEFIALTSGLNYRVLRPEDDLETFPKGSLKKHVLEFAELLVKASPRSEIPNARYWFDPRIHTIDDFIRKLGPLASRVEEHHRLLHQS